MQSTNSSAQEWHVRYAWGFNLLQKAQDRKLTLLDRMEIKLQ